MGDIQRVAIVGGGFSGAMLAARLAEMGVASSLIDRAGGFGLGVAYSTPFDGHLLNVRSSRMSAIEGQPDHFVRWLTKAHPEHADAEGFAPRRLYGLYVQDRLAATEAAHPGLITRVVGEAGSVTDTAVGLADGRNIEADAVVLATGNPAPRVADDAAPAIIGDPWAPGALDRIGPDDDMLIAGTGLTMVDMVLWLAARGWRGKATALSRRGLLPRAHADRPDAVVPPTDDLFHAAPSERLGAARRLSDAEGWRGVMEGLRPMTAELWRRAEDADRARFVRHLRPWWDVHRHRIAAPIAEALDQLRAEGRLRIVAGRIQTLRADAEGVVLDWRPRPGFSDKSAPISARWLIDCTGPGHDPGRDPLTGPLIASGRARLDPLRLGLDLDPEGRALSATGEPDPRLFVLGPPARAAFWETIAVPDIRRRIEDVVNAIAARR